MENKANIEFYLSDDHKKVSSLRYGGREWCAEEQRPLFSISLRERNGTERVFNADAAERITCTGLHEKNIRYDYLESKLRVEVKYAVGEEIIWRIEVDNQTEFAVEYVDFPSISCKGRFKENGGEASVLWPYNEGCLITDSKKKNTMIDPEYPSMGNYAMFPYMIFAQFTAYMVGNLGLYMGLHDTRRSPKGIDFVCEGDYTYFRNRLFMGGEFGESVKNDYEIVWRFFEGDWHDGAEIYREWLRDNMPCGAKKKIENENLPSWYVNEMPVVLTYPIRGAHDTDEMKPNKLYPYANIMPHLRRYSKAFDSKMMVLLMHWEGTAPWAPPYVWPPYGGENEFLEFGNLLHKENHLFGVYCSGFGYTEQSNLIAEYNRREEIEAKDLYRGFNAASDGSVQYSKICTAQRSGYDICPASELGRAILNEAVAPLIKSNVDYVQILDQNHGGSMYFCYSQEHGHPPVPGEWMTRTTRSLLQEWQAMRSGLLLGCESAAAEPYISELCMSDNRFELCYEIGHAIPLYAYLFHKYLHNFMGNQVSNCLGGTVGLKMRIAHSFLCGDLITLILNENGEIVSHWGMRDFTQEVDRKSVCDMIANLCKVYKTYKDLFSFGKMIKPLEYDCDTEAIPKFANVDTEFCERSILSTAWDIDGRKVQLFVNYTDTPGTCKLSLNAAATLHREGDCFDLNIGENIITLAPSEVIAVEWL